MGIAHSLFLVDADNPKVATFDVFEPVVAQEEATHAVENGATGE